MSAFVYAPGVTAVSAIFSAVTASFSIIAVLTLFSVDNVPSDKFDLAFDGLAISDKLFAARRSPPPEILSQTGVDPSPCDFRNCPAVPASSSLISFPVAPSNIATLKSVALDGPTTSPLFPAFRSAMDWAVTVLMLSLSDRSWIMTLSSPATVMPVRDDPFNEAITFVSSVTSASGSIADNLETAASSNAFVFASASYRAFISAPV